MYALRNRPDLVSPPLQPPLRLEGDVWSTVKRPRQTPNEHAPPKPPLPVVGVSVSSRIGPPSRKACKTMSTLPVCRVCTRVLYIRATTPELNNHSSSYKLSFSSLPLSVSVCLSSLGVSLSAFLHTTLDPKSGAAVEHRPRVLVGTEHVRERRKVGTAQSLAARLDRRLPVGLENVSRSRGRRASQPPAVVQGGRVPVGCRNVRGRGGGRGPGTPEVVPPPRVSLGQQDFRAGGRARPRTYSSLVPGQSLSLRHAASDDNHCRQAGTPTGGSVVQTERFPVGWMGVRGGSRRGASGVVAVVPRESVPLGSADVRGGGGKWTFGGASLCRYIALFLFFFCSWSFGIYRLCACFMCVSVSPAGGSAACVVRCDSLPRSIGRSVNTVVGGVGGGQSWLAGDDESEKNIEDITKKR